MAKALEDFDEWKQRDDGTIIVRSHPRLDVEYLTRRTMMFIEMTQGRGKPMTFGAQKKDKK